MRNKELVMMIAVSASVVMASVAQGAPASVDNKPKAVPAKAVAKNTEKTFDQKAVMDKFWSGPDSAVVGSVNGVKVTKGELVSALWARTAPGMLSELLDQRMIEQAAKKAGIKLSKAEEDAQITDILARSGCQSVDQVVSQYKITYSRFINTVRMQALASKLAEMANPVTDAEYAQYFKARHILVLFSQDIKDQTQREAAAKAKIDEIAAKLKNGADFGKLASEVSDDPGSKTKGGDLGWFSKGRMVPEFENAAVALKKGQISEPVKSPYGYHIIQLEGIGRDATPAEKKELKEMIVKQKVPTLVGAYVNNLRTQAKVVNSLLPPAPTAPAAMQPYGAPSPSVAPRPNAPRATPRPPAPPKPAAPKPTEPTAGERPDAPPPPPMD